MVRNHAQTVLRVYRAHLGLYVQQTSRRGVVGAPLQQGRSPMRTSVRAGCAKLAMSRIQTVLCVYPVQRVGPATETWRDRAARAIPARPRTLEWTRRAQCTQGPSESALRFVGVERPSVRHAEPLCQVPTTCYLIRYFPG